MLSNRYNLNERVKLVWRLSDERYILRCRSSQEERHFLMRRFFATLRMTVGSHFESSGKSIISRSVIGSAKQVVN